MATLARLQEEKLNDSRRMLCNNSHFLVPFDPLPPWALNFNPSPPLLPTPLKQPPYLLNTCCWRNWRCASKRASASVVMRSTTGIISVLPSFSCWLRRKMMTSEQTLSLWIRHLINTTHHLEDKVFFYGPWNDRKRKIMT